MTPQTNEKLDPERGRIDQRAAGMVEAIVASAFGLRVEAIHNATRGEARPAFARQVAIYLSYTRLGLTYASAGSFFGRDRTTAAHACRTVEDRREDPELDAIVDFLERAVEGLLEVVRQRRKTP